MKFPVDKCYTIDILITRGNKMQKNQIKEVLDKMPDEIAVGDFVTELYFREKLEKGLEQVKAGKTLSHDQAKNKLSKWLD